MQVKGIAMAWIAPAGFAVAVPPSHAAEWPDKSLIEVEVAKWAKVVKASRAKVDRFRENT